MRFFWRGRRDLNYGSSFYCLKLCEIPYENQCVLFIAYNGVQSNAKPLGEKIGENSGANYRGRNGLRPLLCCSIPRAAAPALSECPRHIRLSRSNRAAE